VRQITLFSGCCSNRRFHLRQLNYTQTLCKKPTMPANFVAAQGPEPMAAERLTGDQRAAYWFGVFLNWSTISRSDSTGWPFKLAGL
jgi:hypothetical protein